MQVSSKLPHVGTTIFTVMSGLAKEYNAINLSQGFPDFNCNPKLLELATKYMNAGFNQYAPMQGNIELRECVARIISKSYARNYNADTEITITSGATQAIYTSIAAFITSGDEVIVFEPVYDCYIPAIELHGAKAICSQLHPTDFSINWLDVKSKVNDKTKMIIINSPHNPSGTILKANDLLELEKIVAGTDILVLSDEVYEHIVFDDQLHQSIARNKTLAAQAIIVSSFGKTVHATGWKIGYVAAPKELMVEFRKVHQYLVFSANHPFQLALAEFLSDTANYLELKHFYQSKRNLFLKLTSNSRLVPLKTSGTYFQLMSYNAISDQADTEFAIQLTKKNKLATIPLSVFYTNKFDQKILRFCFAKKDETLEKAAEIINKL